MKYAETEQGLLEGHMADPIAPHIDGPRRPLDREKFAGEASLIWFLMGAALALMLAVGLVFYSAA